MCLNVNIEIMTQNSLKSRHYKEFSLKHRACASLFAGKSTYITNILVLNYSWRYTLNEMGLRCRRWTNYAEDGPTMKEWDHW